jgi:hypothetical protein
MFPETQQDPLRALRLLSELSCIVDTECMSAIQLAHGLDALTNFSALLPVSTTIL